VLLVDHSGYEVTDLFFCNRIKELHFTNRKCEFAFSLFGSDKYLTIYFRIRLDLKKEGGKKERKSEERKERGKERGERNKESRRN
jgi:hypothetical protein